MVWIRLLSKLISTSSTTPASQQFYLLIMLKKHFAGKTPMIITADWDDYKVVYNTGEKVEFRKNGEWKELSCTGKGVPTALIPAQIKANVKSSFPGAVIIKIDRDRDGYDVKLNNGMELEFNKRFQLVDMDD